MTKRDAARRDRAPGRRRSSARRKAPQPVAVIVEPVSPKIEQELANRIARFLLALTAPEEKRQPHPLD
jgi:hypothetical protein